MVVVTNRLVSRGQEEELTPTETESGSCGVNVPVCLAEPEESALHQLQLRPEGVNGKDYPAGVKGQEATLCQG